MEYTNMTVLGWTSMKIDTLELYSKPVETHNDIYIVNQWWNDLLKERIN